MTTTRSQKMAKRAWTAVEERAPRSQEYVSFAKSFPTLIQTAGLCEAVAFAQAKRASHLEVLEDVIATAGESTGEPVSIATFARACREAELPRYVHLTRQALQAASWVKRYVEALERPDTESPE